MSDQNTTQPTESITKKEIMQFHWENYKMRQSHFWRSFERLILAVVTLWAIPFIKTSLIENKYIVVFFPTVALLLSYIGRKLLKAEYSRLMAVMNKLKELGGESIDFSHQNNSARVQLNSGQIGKIILNQVCIGLIVLSIIDLLIIISMTFGAIDHP